MRYRRLLGAKQLSSAGAAHERRVLPAGMGAKQLSSAGAAYERRVLPAGMGAKQLSSIYAAYKRWVLLTLFDAQLAVKILYEHATTQIKLPSGVRTQETPI